MGEDPTATCEPFFVPRQPVFEDEAYGAAHGSHGSWRRRHFPFGQAHYKVLVNIGLEMLGASSPAHSRGVDAEPCCRAHKSAAHALAFFVATGTSLF